MLARVLRVCVVGLVAVVVLVGGYWDIATTTVRGEAEESMPRQSFFKWMDASPTPSDVVQSMFWTPNYVETNRKRRLYHVVGISIDMKCLSTGTLMNRRVVLTAYNFLDIYMNRMQDLRIWALGRGGTNITPYRYRVHRVVRPMPRSASAEHCHGARCMHSPRDDLAVVWSLDQIYVLEELNANFAYPYRALFAHTKYDILPEDIWFAGSGFRNLEHIRENYEILYHTLTKDWIRDCSSYLPKYWGKFICIINNKTVSGLQNGAGFYGDDTLYGIGSFEIRYNDVRLLVFTDLRYYWYKVHHYAFLWPGSYYEYAYPQWGVNLGTLFDGSGNTPYIPQYQIRDDFYPLG